MKWFERLSGMNGRLTLTREEEAVCLAKYASIPGDYVEIGTLWGGSAIVAALAKKDAAAPGEVYTIDPMAGGWWKSEDPEIHMRPTRELVEANFKKYHLSKKVHFVVEKADPWPIAKTVHPTTIFIDGDHSFEAVSADWKNASAISHRYILLHDYNSKNHPGVQKAVDEVARKDAGWKFVELVNSVAVFEKVK